MSELACVGSLDREFNAIAWPPKNVVFQKGGEEIADKLGWTIARHDKVEISRRVDLLIQIFA